MDTGNDDDLVWMLSEYVLMCTSSIGLTLFNLASSFTYEMTS